MPPPHPPPPPHPKVLRHVAVTPRSEVFEASLDSQPVCVKRVNILEVDVRGLRDEILLMTRLSHPHVVKFIGVRVEMPYVCIVTEWMPLQSLFDLLADREPCEWGVDSHGDASSASSSGISMNTSMDSTMEGSNTKSNSDQAHKVLGWNSKLAMAIDAVRGMCYLHSSKPPTIHRDLKTRNLLVDSSLRVKVADFGLSHMSLVRSAFIGGSHSMGTPAYIAPELIEGRPFTTSIDVYAFGIVLWELHTHTVPYEGINDATIFFKNVFKQARPPFDVQPPVPTPIAQLCTQCWSVSPNARPPFPVVLEELCSIREKLITNTPTPPPPSPLE